MTGICECRQLIWSDYKNRSPLLNAPNINRKALFKINQSDPFIPYLKQINDLRGSDPMPET